MVDGEKATRSKAGTGAQAKARVGKGGRKGGTSFPRVALKQALEYSKKLVSKTAIGPQPEATILAGVFNNAGPEGKIRLSALKRFGLLEGKRAAYRATQLARDLEVAADETEKKPLLRRAILGPKVYHELVNTYHGDEASKAKIRSRVQQLGVHPDLAETCAELFIASAVTAGVATASGDGIRLVDAAEVAQPETPETEEPDGGVTGIEESRSANAAVGAKEHADVPVVQTGDQTDASKLPGPRPRMAADVTVNLTVDSSLDGDKLEKQLALLRRYGLI
jgi:hypothetical protein